VQASFVGVAMQEVLRLLEDLPEKYEKFYGELLSTAYRCGRHNADSDWFDLTVLTKILVDRVKEDYLEESLIRDRYN